MAHVSITLNAALDALRDAKSTIGDIALSFDKSQSPGSIDAKETWYLYCRIANAIDDIENARSDYRSKADRII